MRRFYKDSSHTEFWGDEKYTGGKDGSEQNFPGCKGNSALVIPGATFDVYFHSDFSVGDWGYKITVSALKLGEENGLEGAAQLVMPSGELVLESAHPYAGGMNEHTFVEIPDALAYLLTFDDASTLEAPYDFLM